VTPKYPRILAERENVLNEIEAHGQMSRVVGWAETLAGVLGQIDAEIAALGPEGLARRAEAERAADLQTTRVEWDDHQPDGATHKVIVHEDNPAGPSWAVFPDPDLDPEVALDHWFSGTWFDVPEDIGQTRAEWTVDATAIRLADGAEFHRRYSWSEYESRASANEVLARIGGAA
jgi:hypothetical protein